jgi:hypothetical protein
MGWGTYAGSTGVRPNELEAILASLMAGRANGETNAGDSSCTSNEIIFQINKEVMINSGIACHSQQSYKKQAVPATRVLVCHHSKMKHLKADSCNRI